MKMSGLEGGGEDCFSRGKARSEDRWLEGMVGLLCQKEKVRISRLEGGGKDRRHKIIKRKNGKQRKSLMIWLIFFLFLQTKPSFSPLFALSQLDFSATSVSVSAVSL